MDVKKRVLFLLQLTGTSPSKQAILSHVMFVLTMVTVCSSVYFNVSSLIHDHSFDNVSGLVESLPISYQTFTKVVRTKLKAGQMQRLLEKMSDFWDADRIGKDGGVTEARRRIFRGIYAGFTGLSIGMVLIYCVKPLTMARRWWPIPWNYRVCDIDNDYCYVLVYVWQLHDGVLTFLSLTSFDGIFMFITFNVYEQLCFVKKRFEMLRSTEDHDKDLQDFNEIVNHHNFLLETIKDTDDIFNVLLFEQLWSSNVSICMGIFLLLLDGDFSFGKIMKYATYLSAFVLEAFFFCYFGQLVANAADDIAFAVYESDWMGTTKMEWKKGVVLVTQMAQNSPKLTVAKILELNMETFGAVLKNSLSFCTLMQSIYNF